MAAYENELNCDGVYQCADRSDEADCASSQVPTKEIELGAFECKYVEFARSLPNLINNTISEEGVS